MSEPVAPEPPTIAPPTYEDLATPPIDNPYFLSAAAHDAMATAPAVVLALEGVYQLSHGDFAGSVSVMPGTTRGANRVGIYLRRSGARDGGLRLFANIRTSWLHAACRGAKSDGERAVLLAAALCELAAIPGQQTVAVMTELASPVDELTTFAMLLRDMANATVEPAA